MQPSRTTLPKWGKKYKNCELLWDTYGNSLLEVPIRFNTITMPIGTNNWNVRIETFHLVKQTLQVQIELNLQDFGWIRRSFKMHFIVVLLPTKIQIILQTHI